MVVDDPASSAITARVLTTKELGALDFDVAAIDVPIGLTDSGRRPPDNLARARLGWPRSSSVFPAPIRPALHAASWEEACEITAAADGRRVPKQTFAILPKIREIDDLLQANPPLARRLFEVHPEVSFAEWAGEPLVHGKRTDAGQREREQLINERYGRGIVDSLAADVYGRKFARDDLVDAMACLWTAERLLAGTHGRLPVEAVFDSTGLPMHIWY